MTYNLDARFIEHRRHSTNTQDMEDIMIRTAMTSKSPTTNFKGGIEFNHLKNLRRLRRTTRVPAERRALSEEIWRLARTERRRRLAQRTTDILAQVAKLQRLDALHRKPITRTSNIKPNYEKCAELLIEVYKSSSRMEEIEYEYQSNEIPPFSVPEVTNAIKGMSKGKAPDRNVVLLEMFLYADEELLQYLTFIFNHILQTGNIPDNWRVSFFTLLHKGNDASDPNNWRPIAVLTISYRIFAKVIFNRIRGILDAEQSEEQFGFQRGRSTTDALIVAETMIGRSLEFNTDLWFD